MSVPILQLIPSNSGVQTNEFGETPLAYAPTITLANGKRAVPQQYLDVERDLANLSNVLACISTPENYQLFAGQEGSCLFLVVGVFGQENYPRSAKAAEQAKIVYGRRWLIEDTTPTSEIVQTAMLAVKKAREHEARELITLRVANGQRLTTPFNCHLDLPLMAGNRSEFDYPESPDTVAEMLDRIRIAGGALKLVVSQIVGSKLIVELVLKDQLAAAHFPELSGSSLTVVCDHANGQDFLHQLSKALIRASDRYVEEHVSFDGFKRFSHALCPEKMAEFSYQTRNVPITDSRFDAAFTDMSYRVDAAKAPLYNEGRLGRQQRAAVHEYPDLAGYVPREAS